MAHVSVCARHSIFMSWAFDRPFLVASSFCLSPCFSQSFTSSLPHSTCTLTRTPSSMWTAPRETLAAPSPNEEYCPLAIYHPPTDWAEDRYDQPFSESDIQQVAAKETWVDMANFNMQLHGDLVSLMEECTEGFEIVRNTKTEVELDAWRRLNHKNGPRNPLRNIQLLERLLATTHVGYSNVVASMERIEQELRVVRQGFCDEVQNLWTSVQVVCIQKICPKILRDHLAAQAASIDSLGSRDWRSRSSFRQTCTDREHRPWMLTPLPRPREARKAAKEKTKGASQRSLMVTSGDACGHMMEDFQKKASGKPQASKSPRGPVQCQSRSSPEVGTSTVSRVHMPDHDPGGSRPVKRFTIFGKVSASKRSGDTGLAHPTETFQDPW